MADSSFDVVSRIEMPEIVNAVDQSMREISQRYDFKGSISKIELNEKDKKLIVHADDAQKLKHVLDILQGKLVKRSVPLRNLVYEKVEAASGDTVRQDITLQNGIQPEKAKEIVKVIKESKIKVQGQIREGEVRVSGKKLDDLQTVIALLKGHDFGVDLQFVNYR
ncbi:MAG: YajQ family cyclic di-GMP-binding protein [Nitrospinae bacterium]|nr:YajQ family cyclic di-GMP-binding protein [Nitrospinota bacterium]